MSEFEHKVGIFPKVEVYDARGDDAWGIDAYEDVYLRLNGKNEGSLYLSYVEVETLRDVLTEILGKRVDTE